MRRIPLLLKHFMILMCIMIALVAIIVWYSASRMLKYSELEIAESSLAETMANRELAEEVMKHMMENTIVLASSHIFDSIHHIQALSELDDEHLEHAMSIQSQLSGMVKMHSGVYSSFFYLEDTDYVISTDKGITSLHNYELNWLSIALEKQAGITGVWLSRWHNENQKSLISYVLPLNRLNTATKGTLVINLDESELKRYLSSGQAGFQEYMLINEHGFIISHSDPSKLFHHIARDDFYKQLLSDPRNAGYTYIEENGKRQLVTWSRSELTGWLSVQTYESALQIRLTYSMRGHLVILAISVLAIGFLIALIVTKKLSIPMNKLVRMANKRIEQSGEARNELLILEDAFTRMQEEEQELQRQLNEREQDAIRLLQQQVIRGEIAKQALNVFNKGYFIVTILSIDGYRKYSLRHDKESRSMQQIQFIAATEQYELEHTKVSCIYQGNGYYVILFNCDETAPILDRKQLKQLLTRLQHNAAEIFQQSVTLSASCYTQSIDEVHKQYVMASEGIKQRMLQGSGNIYDCAEQLEAADIIYYPADSEKRLLNHLDQCDFNKVKAEVQLIFKELIQQSCLSPDSVQFVSHQLVGATMKHLREKNVNVQRFLSVNRNIYAYLAMSETLEEVEDALVSFYEDIINYLFESTGSHHYGDSIIQYLEHHYRKDIVFEEMAEEIGISYSYMRKIMMDRTGKSLIDYVHMLRIEQAKKLLKTTAISIGQIAEDVGYNNIRSFNRFFQKAEGMTPSAFRSKTSKGNVNANAKIVIEQ